MRDALVTPLLDAVVWMQGRDESDRDLGSFDAPRDYRNLFAARPDNVLLVKAAYWVGR